MEVLAGPRAKQDCAALRSQRTAVRKANQSHAFDSPAPGEGSDARTVRPDEEYMTGDELVRILAWPALGLWLIALVFFVRRRDRSVAIIQGVLALPFVIGAAMALTKWGIDPAEYTRQYGTAALHALPTDAIILGIALFILVSCGLAMRGRRLWLIPPLLLNGVGVVVLFYFAYFFRIF